MEPDEESQQQDSEAEVVTSAVRAEHDPAEVPGADSDEASADSEAPATE